MKQRLPLLVGLVALVAIIVVAVVMINGKKSDKDTSSSANPTTHSQASMNDTIETDKVDIKDMMFMPVTIKVKAGTTVTWTNSDSVAHTVTLAGNPNLAFTSGSLAKGETYTMTFKKAGTYDYTCDFHSNMHGTVVVTD
jgi:amicyanin